MNKAFEIDYIRQIIIQTLQKEHNENPNYIGGDNQVRLTSFYEHLASDDEVDRYVATVRDLTNQQNRLGLIANGVILAPSNPTITNLNQCTIIPLEFTINFRCTLANRDILKGTLDNVVSILKGRKQDIAELDNGKLFMVGTLGNNINGTPLIRNGDFIGSYTPSETLTLDTFIDNKILDLQQNKGFYTYSKQVNNYLYYEDTNDNQLKVAVVKYDEESETNVWYPQLETKDYPNIIFPSQHNSFKKWKVSLSFDSFRCSEPRTLNANEFCDLSFGGSATIVSESVMLGNELTKLSIKKVGYKSASGLVASSDTTNYWLEPLEMPSGNGASTIANQLNSNKFITNSHTDGLTISRQYSFVYDYSIPLLKQLFNYARYGTFNTTINNVQYTITPNMIYEVGELFSEWGNVELIKSNTRIVEDIDIENNENDILTITLPMQLQGDND